MSNSLAGKTALVTGGGVGIGFEIAAALAAAGARVAVTYRSHQPDDDQMKQLVASDGSQPLAIASDATDDDSAAKLMNTIENEFGKLDILVNNAGGLVQRCLIKDMDFALWRSVQAVNTDSAFLTTHHALPLLSSPGGRVINIASSPDATEGTPVLPPTPPARPPSSASPEAWQKKSPRMASLSMPSHPGSSRQPPSTTPSRPNPLRPQRLAPSRQAGRADQAMSPTLFSGSRGRADLLSPAPWWTSTAPSTSDKP